MTEYCESWESYRCSTECLTWTAATVNWIRERLQNNWRHSHFCSSINTSVAAVAAASGNWHWLPVLSAIGSWLSAIGSRRDVGCTKAFAERWPEVSLKSDSLVRSGRSGASGERRLVGSIRQTALACLFTFSTIQHVVLPTLSASAPFR